MTELLIEQIVNGIVTGSVYALVAVGMTMIFGVLRAINFAHGEYYMLGTFAAWYVIDESGRFLRRWRSSLARDHHHGHRGGDRPAGDAAAGRGTVPGRRARHARPVADPAEHWSSSPSAAATSSSPAADIEPVFFGDFSLAQQRIIIVWSTIVVFVGLELMVRRTRMGKAMRAVSQNIECCQVIGIDVEQVVLRTFMLGGGAGGSVRRADGAGQRQRLWRHG